MKHLRFESIYRDNFEVVEQRQGNLRLFPHTEQLPILLRAVNLEFYGGLPGRLARADKRASDFDKIALKTAGLMFCYSVNGERSDDLTLHCIPDRDLVPRIVIVQHITEDHPRGLVHRFRFYGGENFFQEIYISGKRIAFADHVLQRFSARVPNNIAADLSNFLITFFGSPQLVMPVGRGHAMVMGYVDSIVALTFKESESEFFVTTCLSINELNDLSLEVPPRALNLHYDLPFTRPKVRNWFPTRYMHNFYNIWEKKTPVREVKKSSYSRSEWHSIGHWVKGNAIKVGHGPTSRVCFQDHIPGPCVLQIKPGEHEPQFDELEIFKKSDPSYDWDAIFAERYGEKPPQ